MILAPTIRRFAALSVAGTLLSVSPVAIEVARAGEPKLTPEKAEELRASARSKASSAGSTGEEADLLFRSGEELGDPVLMLDGADRLRSEAGTERSKEIARTGLAWVDIADDVAGYMASEHYAQTRWHPVASEVVSAVQTRAANLRADLEALIAEIEEEERAAAAAAAAAANQDDGGNKRGPPKPGTGLIAGGASLMVLGAGGVGLMTAGLMIGADTQAKVEALDITTQRDEYDRLDADGKRANVFAYVGGAVAAVGLGVGLGLIIAGAKKRRGAGGSEEKAAETAWIMLVPRATGATLVGRF